MGTVSQTVGVDLAKNVFSICELDAGGRVRQRRDLQRAGFAVWLAQLPVGTVVVAPSNGAAACGQRREDDGVSKDSISLTRAKR
jgi:hypothetical protein